MGPRKNGLHVAGLRLPAVFEMSFSDEDLKRLREEMGTVEQERWIRGETNVAPIEALIARLEAAERCAGHLNNVAPGCELYVAWRKAAGK